MTRKSPCRHRVRAHKRNKRPVRKYMRGAGNRPPQPAGRRRRVGNPVTKNPQSHSPGFYDVHITYFDGDVERLEADAKNYEGALTAGIEGREEPKPPRIIRMRELR